MSAAVRAADGVLLVVDAVEGVMLVTEKVVRQALTEGLPICLLITKVRLASCRSRQGSPALVREDMLGI